MGPPMTPIEVRLQMIENGYPPVACNGKEPVMRQWERQTDVSPDTLAVWARDFPTATNTGMLCPMTPTFDIDVSNPEAVDAIVALVEERFGDRGKVLLRTGRRPRLAVPFRTNTPFKKIKVELIAPDGDGDTEQKLEFLGMGQQVIVHGIHPDTHEPYQWRNGNPGNVKRVELASITAEEAQSLMHDAVAVLEPFGYQRADRIKGEPKDNGRDTDVAPNSADPWGRLSADILAGRSLHDNIRDLAIRLVASGMSGGAATNLLRGLMERSEAPRDQRWQKRYDDIPRAVGSAERLPRENEEREPPPPVGEDDPPEPTPDSPEPEPVPDASESPSESPIANEGEAALNAVHAYLTRFVAFPSEAASVAHTLWCGHTHMMSAWESTPREAFLSAEPESGKTRVLEASEPLLPNVVNTVNASVAYLFRKCADPNNLPTVLFDEIDTIFGPRNDKQHEDVRGFINAGHRRGATFGRCVVHGSAVLTEETPIYAPVAMAGLGWLPDTLLSRSIIIRMRRRLKTEKIEPFRHRIHNPEGKKIEGRLATWAKTVVKRAAAMRPTMPEGVEDRQADAWEPLLAVAELAGGQWPRRARGAAVALVAVNRERPVSLHLRLLEDMRTVFFKQLAAVSIATPKGLPTRILIDQLYALEDGPWQTLNKGDGLNSNQVAFYIHDYGVEPNLLRPDPANPKKRARGYLLGELADAWRRYLQPLSVDGFDVPAVPAVTRTVLDQYFEWQVAPNDEEYGTAGTSGTPNPETERGPRLDPTRIHQLAEWWRKEAARLQAEMRPAVLQAHLDRLLRETLAEELPAESVDAEARRVVRAAGKRQTDGQAIEVRTPRG
jgi:Protein of unknown function (DUF3631)/Bifunctional DNA primase/polymerase, N-terminal